MEFSTTFVSGFVIFGLNKKIGPYVRVCMCKVCAEFFGGIFKKWRQTLKLKISEAVANPIFNKTRGLKSYIIPRHKLG